MCEHITEEKMGGIVVDAEKIFAEFLRKGYNQEEINAIIAIASIELSVMQLFN